MKLKASKVDYYNKFYEIKTELQQSKVAGVGEVYIWPIMEIDFIVFSERGE